MRRALPTVRPDQLGLGRPTIMDAGLAARHGVPYVHLAALAIDLDRIRDHVDELPDAESLWPLGWEVFLLELYLEGSLDLEDATAREMLADVVVGLIEAEVDPPPLGATLAFAVFDGVRRGHLPAELGAPFARWRDRRGPLEASLDELFANPAVEASDLAEACLEVEPELPVKLSPPARDALAAMVSTFERDEAYEGDEPS